MTRRIYIITCSPGGQSFWAGNRWVFEYPDAELFTKHEALAAIKEARRRANLLCDVRIIRDYGLTSEAVIGIYQGMEA